MPKRLNDDQRRLVRELVPVALYDPVSGLYAGKGALRALGYVAMPVGATAAALGEPPAATSITFMRCEGGVIRYRDDGPAPTAAMGMPMYPGSSLEYDAQVGMFKAIRVSGTPILHAIFYGYAA